MPENPSTGTHSEWRAKTALACYFALIGSILLVSFIVEFVLLGMRIDYLDLPFSIVFVSIPLNETIILLITVLFARHNRVSLKNLGLKKVSFNVFAIVSFAAVLLYLLVFGISIGEEIIFGPDPLGERVTMLMIPRDPFQLFAMILLLSVLVGPCEELAFRGFVQKGFENSFGTMQGLLLTAALFGVLHGLNTPYAIGPLFVVGLVFGYVWQKTGGNTTASAILHGMYNSIGIVVAYFASI